MCSNFKPLFNIPITLKSQDVVRLTPSDAVHDTVLVPIGKEPCSLLPIVDNVITLLVGDRARQKTFTVLQLS